MYSRRDDPLRDYLLATLIGLAMLFVWGAAQHRADNGKTPHTLEAQR